jgi:hypothetical protein
MSKARSKKKKIDARSSSKRKIPTVTSNKVASTPIRIANRAILTLSATCRMRPGKTTFKDLGRLSAPYFTEG